jgi:glycosyltransferase involved in cell wall biosynthesis
VRVLIVTPWYPWPENPVRGIWTIDHAKALMREHDVVMLAFSPRQDAARPYELDDKVEDGLRTLRLTYPPPRLPGAGLIPARRGALEALGRLRDAGFLPDIVHGHIFLSGPAALPLARRADAPLVIQENLTRVTEGQLGLSERALARYVYRRADIVCPNNDRLERAVGRLGARATRKLPNVLDARFSLRSRRREDGGIRAINVASLHEKKGHSYLLDALASMRDPRITVDLVGDGPLRGELEKRVTDLGLEQVVRFHGFATHERVAELLGGSDLLVLPSLRENQPLVVAEAMASGLPTVGTDVGGVAEMLEGGAGVVIPPADSEALARAIAAVAGGLDHYDPAVLAKLAEDRYGPESVARRWTETYRELVERR